MKTEQIKYFLDIAQTHSISRTAEHFYISQQAVSDAMKRLEDEFSCKLLRRRKNGVTLTDEGELFLREATRIMDAYVRLQLALNPQYQDKNDLNGNLRVIVHPRLYHLGLKDFLRQFMFKYPQVKLSFVEGDNQQIHEAMRLKQADFGLLFGRGMWPEESEILEEISEQVLYTDDVYICYTAPHPLTAYTELTLEVLGRYPVTSFASQRFIETYDHLQLDKKTNVFFCSDIAAQCDFIRSGTAAGVLTGHECRTLFKKEEQITTMLVRDETAEVILLYMPQNAQDIVYQAFMTDLITYYRDSTAKFSPQG